jgi:protein gp37
MAAKSSIEWTESTWNPITGCTKISPGCANCYAERMAVRLKAMGQPNYKNGFDVTTHHHVLETPLHWKKPQTIFVNSMSDLFHENVPEDFILKMFDVMNNAHWHRFQILTKRSYRLAEISSKLSWTQNIWMGVTVENADYKYRVDDLRHSGAHIKFLSMEPLISPVRELDLKDIDWVIAGGESGPKARPMKVEWARDIRDQCKTNNTPFFFKQWGGTRKKKNGRVLDGKLWDELPVKSRR